jgi:hypothetical protein
MHAVPRVPAPARVALQHPLQTHPSALSMASNSIMSAPMSAAMEKDTMVFSWEGCKAHACIHDTLRNKGVWV